MKTRVITLILLSAVTLTSFGQSKKRRNEIEYINSLQFTGGFGSGTYFGDLCDNFECAVFRPTSNVGILFRNSERIMLRADFHFIRLYGTDAGGDNVRRNLHFASNNLEFVVSGIYDLIPYERRYRYRSTYTPFVHAGIGATYFTPKAKLNGSWYNLRKFQTEGVSYSKVTPVVAYGAGLRFKITPKLNITTEFGYRWTFTDYLDDVSTVYADQSGDETAAALADRTNELDVNINNRNYDQSTQNWAVGHQRGNPKRKDGYFLLELKAEYRLMWTSQGGSILRKSKFR